MSDGGVSLNVTTNDGVTAVLATLAKRIGHLDPALAEIGAANVTETQDRFEKQVDPTGTKWKELAPLTLSMRKAPNPIILSVTRNLYDSVGFAVDSQKGVKIGSNRIYARIQQLGGKAGRGLAVTIPARPYLGVSADGMKEIESILKDYLEPEAA